MKDGEEGGRDGERGKYRLRENEGERGKSEG
jgi:hypothetical protein